MTRLAVGLVSMQPQPTALAQGSNGRGQVQRACRLSGADFTCSPLS